MRQKYPSDIMRERFSEIEADLATEKKKRPRNYELYDVFCALLYVLKGGCTWRGLPHDFPKWQNVYYHFCIWKKAGANSESLLDKVLHKLVESERMKNGRNKDSTMNIVDSRSVKNADTAMDKGYDGEKEAVLKQSNRREHSLNTAALY